MLKIPTTYITTGGGFGTEFGDAIHKIIEKLLVGKTKITDYSGNEKVTLENVGLAEKELSKIFPGLQLVDTEMKFQDFPISEITDYSGNVTLDGKIDAVYKHNDGVLLVDWKTNKKSESYHKQQVEFYKKVYAKLENVPEDKITTCVVYLSLRGSINTGSLETKLDFVERGNPFGTFEKHLKQILEWKDDPKKFIEKILQVKDDETLLEIIKSQLVQT